MSIHQSPSEFARTTVKVTTMLPLGDNPAGTHEIRIEDWWDRVAGQSWGMFQGNPACLMYAMRSAMSGLPLDDEVLYGKDSRDLGHLVHVSEIETPVVHRTSGGVS